LCAANDRELMRDMSDAKYVRGLAERCRRLAKTSFDFELSAELKDIADDLTAKAEAWERRETSSSPSPLEGGSQGEAPS
jgi:hypothetical protein